MDSIKNLFDYQRFAQNPKLQALLDAVYLRYLSGGEELPDEMLEVAAAGEPRTFLPGNGLCSPDAERNGHDDSGR